MIQQREAKDNSIIIYTDGDWIGSLHTFERGDRDNTQPVIGIC